MNFIRVKMSKFKLVRDRITSEDAQLYEYVGTRYGVAYFTFAV